MDGIVLAISNILCFIIGAMVGQKVVKGEDIKLPSPVKAIKEHKKQVEAEQAQSKLDTIMSNVESYNGTSFGQKDVPR